LLFQRFGMLDTSHLSNHMIKAVLLAVTFLVATISWKFVETPFRTGRLMLTGRQPFVFAAVSAAMLTVLGVSLIAYNSLTLRHSHQQLALSATKADQAKAEQTQITQNVKPGVSPPRLNALLNPLRKLL
jgi:hypothetical protein